jgi:hypothetical protein
VISKYFTWDLPKPPALLRVSDKGHELFDGSSWAPTELILEYFAGERHDIDPVTEAEARLINSSAFKN